MAGGQMMHSEGRAGLLRGQGERGHRVTTVELFFDLVYVFAVTQLSHLLLEHLTLRGAVQTLMVLLAVWWAWVYTAWFTNWFDPDQPAVRLVMVAVMLVSLIMSAALPEAFGERGLAFAGAYTAIQIGRTAFVVVAFIGSVALWWVYFDRGAAWANEVIASSADPGRLGRSAYTYFHLPMVAGIIVAAVADELTIAHPGASGTISTTAVILGGPALYLAGHALFKHALSGRLFRSHVVAVAALAALIPVGLLAPLLATGIAATAVVVAVAVWDTRAVRSLGHVPSVQPVGEA